MRLDNKGAVLVAGKVRHYSERDLLNQQDGDIWEAIKDLLSQGPSIGSVTWWPGHPERSPNAKIFEEYASHDWAVHHADVEADEASGETEGDQAPGRYAGNSGWNFLYRGEVIHSGLKQHSRRAIIRDDLTLYLTSPKYKWRWDPAWVSGVDLLQLTREVNRNR